MAVEAGDVIRASAVMLQGGTDEVVNVFHVRITTDPGSSDDDEAAQDIAQRISAGYQQINGSLSSTLLYDRIDMQNVTKNEQMPSKDFTHASTGGGAGEPPSPQIASLMVFGVGIPGVQGRKYLPPFTEGLLNGGAISAGGLALLDLLGAQYVGIKVGLNGWEMEFGVRRSGSGTFLPFVSFRPIPFTRTQRRRTAGRGS